MHIVAVNKDEKPKKPKRKGPDKTQKRHREAKEKKMLSRGTKRTRGSGTISGLIAMMVMFIIAVSPLSAEVPIRLLPTPDGAAAVAGTKVATCTASRDMILKTLVITDSATVAGSTIITSDSMPTSIMTTNTDQDVSGIKTFSTQQVFEEGASARRVTIYDPDAAEPAALVTALQYNHSTTTWESQTHPAYITGESLQLLDEDARYFEGASVGYWSKVYPNNLLTTQSSVKRTGNYALQGSWQTTPGTAKMYLKYRVDSTGYRSKNGTMSLYLRCSSNGTEHYVRVYEYNGSTTVQLSTETVAVPSASWYNATASFAISATSEWIEIQVESRFLGGWSLYMDDLSFTVEGIVSPAKYTFEKNATSEDLEVLDRAGNPLMLVDEDGNVETTGDVTVGGDLLPVGDVITGGNDVVASAGDVFDMEPSSSVPQTRFTSGVALGVHITNDASRPVLRAKFYGGVYPNVEFGAGAGEKITSGYGNFGAGHGVHEDLTSGYCNGAIGYATQKDVTTGSSNFGCGYNVQAVMTTGSNNLAVGGGTQGALTSGSSNCAVGNGAQNDLTTGGSNFGVGHSVQQVMTTGYSNSGVGEFTQGALTTGGSNTAHGFYAQRYLQTGSSNTAFGTHAQHYISGGSSNNVAAGHYAGRGLGEYTANDVIALGQYSASQAAGASTIENIVALGKYAGYTPVSGNAYIGGWNGTTQYPLHLNFETDAVSDDALPVTINRTDYVIPVGVAGSPQAFPNGIEIGPSAEASIADNGDFVTTGDIESDGGQIICSTGDATTGIANINAAISPNYADSSALTGTAYSPSNSFMAFAFTAGQSYDFGGVTVRMRQGTINVSSYFVASLRADNAGEPGTTLQGLGGGCHGAALTASYQSIFFGCTSYALSAGTKYWIVIQRYGTGFAEFDSGGTTGGEMAESTDGSTWITGGTYDIYYSTEKASRRAGHFTARRNLAIYAEAQGTAAQFFGRGVSSHGVYAAGGQFSMYADAPYGYEGAAVRAVGNLYNSAIYATGVASSGQAIINVSASANAAPAIHAAGSTASNGYVVRVFDQGTGYCLHTRSTGSKGGGLYIQQGETLSANNDKELAVFIRNGNTTSYSYTQPMVELIETLGGVTTDANDTISVLWSGGYHAAGGKDLIAFDPNTTALDDPANNFVFRNIKRADFYLDMGGNLSLPGQVMTTSIRFTDTTTVADGVLASDEMELFASNGELQLKFGSDDEVVIIGTNP